MSGSARASPQRYQYHWEAQKLYVLPSCNCLYTSIFNSELFYQKYKQWGPIFALIKVPFLKLETSLLLGKRSLLLSMNGRPLFLSLRPNRGWFWCCCLSFVVRSIFSLVWWLCDKNGCLMKSQASRGRAVQSVERPSKGSARSVQLNWHGFDSRLRHRS